MNDLGYEFRRDANGNNPSIIAKGWERPVRLKSLGAKYDPEEMKEKIISNQYKKELYWIEMPARVRTPLLIIEQSLRQAGRMDGLQLTFAIFTELLKICTGNNLLAENKHLPLSPLLREEVRKLDQYIEDYKLLCDRHIDTAEELFAFREDINTQITQLERERELIRNKIRRAPEEEKGALKLRAKAVTEKITPLRAQQKTARRIAERTHQMQNLLTLERLQETQFTRARNERSYTR
jgi:hypothetical protein